jgi:hypothetical protein
MTDPKALATLIKDLGLIAVKEDWAAGEFDGVPLAVNVVATSEASGLLFHVRYPEKAFTNENPPLPEGSGLAQMAASGDAEVSLDSRTGWLSIFSRDSNLTLAGVRGLLIEFFEVLKSQGVDLRRRLCLKCTAQPVDHPEFRDDRLQLLCEACNAEEKDRFRRETELSLGNIPLLIVPGAISAVAGAIVWAGLWYSYPIVLEKLSARSVPVLLLAVMYAGTGILIGKIISFFISRVRNRGTYFAASIALLFCVMALVLGEMLHISALCLKYLGFIPPPPVIGDLWISILREFSILYGLGKLISVGTALYIAYSDALPKRRAN